MMHWYDGFYGYSMGHPLGWLFMIFFWLFLIFGIIYLVRNLRRPPETKRETPLDIIRRRYAEGEISREEFDKLKKDLDD